MKTKIKTVLTLFITFLKIGAFTFGGGYAMIPLIQKETVEKKKWMTDEDILEIVAIAESTPGPIAINAATFVGIRVAGLPGALAATFGCIVPSCVIVSLLAALYRRYHKLSALQNVLSCLRPAVVALIAAAGCSILRLVLFDDLAARLENLNVLPALLFAAALVVLRWKKPNPILVMGLCGVLYTAIELLRGAG